MKLYELPRGSRFRFDEEMKLANGETVKEAEFLNMDGAFGRCMIGGKVVHLPAHTKVEYLGAIKNEDQAELF